MFTSAKLSMVVDAKCVMGKGVREECETPSTVALCVLFFSICAAVCCCEGVRTNITGRRAVPFSWGTGMAWWRDRCPKA